MKTVFALAIFGAAVPAQAAGGLQDLDAMERKLVIALGADIGQPGGPTAPIDRRLRLMQCPSDVKIEPPLLNAATVRCQEIGWRIRVPLIAGGAVRTQVASAAPIAAAVRAAPVIRRGDPVELRVRTGPITVSNQVIAQEDGAPGERIRVRADNRTAPVIAEVVDAGIVRMPGFN